MGAFERVRRQAAELHARAITLGADPCRPDEIVHHAARDLDVEIAIVPQSSATLHGARALYDAQSQLVCCADDGDAVEQALLIGHELGHVVLHASQSRCDTSDIEASLSIEQAPVGLERVEDYGARERRELHANVFARELVLPSSLARRLYAEEYLAASEIAARTGLPPTLIRQQVLDALLLPPSEDVPEEPAPVVREPDPSQDVAAHHEGSAFNLQAGPGTGKTRTLVDRVKWLLTQGVDPSAIVVLTFSNRAAGELAERFAEAVPEAVTQIWTGTFHAFGLDLIRRYHDRLGTSVDPRLFDRSDAIAAMQDALPTLPLRHYRNIWDPALILRDILAAISRAKDELVDSKHYRELAVRMLGEAHDDETRIAAEKCLEVAQVYELYERELRKRDALDFGDLIMRPAMLLESDESLRTQVSTRHPYVLVDEFQDVNRASARLLKAISGNGERLWVVGDARQSIYRFRGASAANLRRFREDFQGDVGQLAVNYRSTEQIVRAFAAVSPHLKVSDGQSPLRLHAMRGPGPASPEIRTFDDPDAEAAGIAQSIRELESQGVHLREQAVLCRSNARIGILAAALEARGIAVLHLGSLFERDEVRDLLALLSLATDNYSDGLVRVAAMPRYRLNLQDVYVATKWLRGADYRPIEGLEPCARNAPGLSKEGASGLALLASDLSGLSQSLPPWDFLCTYLLDRTGSLRESDLNESIAGRMKGVALWQFLNFVRAPTFGGTGSPVRRLLDRVRELVLLAEERSLRQVPNGALHLNAVRLMTVHASKGLEFEAVHLPGFTVSGFPASYQGQRCPPPRGMLDGSTHTSVADQAKHDHQSEEECLFFVALSRAKTHLRLYRHAKTSGGTNRRPSPFLAWLESVGVREVSYTVPSPAAGEARNGRIEVRSLSERHVTADDIAQYDRCPRRFFYTRVLQLGNARYPTAFSRTHDCVYDLITWYRVQRRAAAPSLAETEAALEEIWLKKGPTDHAYAAEYRHLASSLAAALVACDLSGPSVEQEPIALSFASGSILLEPVAIRRPNGQKVIRRLNTGKKRSDEFDRLEYAQYVLAGEQIGAAVEAVFLATGTFEPVAMTAKVLANRRATIESYLAAMRAGDFTTNPDAVRCPRCPHFFVCDTVPAGPLTVD